MPILTVHNLTVRFGGILALDSVSFDVDEGAIVGLIGPNGAGKTTLFNCLSRLDTPDGGDVRFDVARRRRRPLRRPPDPRAVGPSHRGAWHRADVPEPRALPDADRAPERHGRGPLPHGQRRLVERALAPVGRPRGGGDPRARERAPPVPRPRRAR